MKCRDVRITIRQPQNQHSYSSYSTITIKFVYILGLKYLRETMLSYEIISHGNYYSRFTI